MMVNMEKYTHNLEELVGNRTAALEVEKRKTEELLHRMLPKYGNISTNENRATWALVKHVNVMSAVLTFFVEARSPETDHGGRNRARVL